MKAVVFFALVAVAYGAPQYVFDFQKIPLNAAEVASLLAEKSYPILNSIPDEAQNFDCSSKKQSGFYADTRYNCQVFHRCDVNGNHTVYSCVNSTLFNQLTLICDYWYNVDCNRAKDFEDFANSRLYTDQPLFDSPPAEYVAPSQKGQQASQAKPAVAASSGGSKPASKATKPPPKGSVKVGGSASVNIQSRANDENAGASAESNEAASNVASSAAPEVTTAAGEEATTEAAETTTQSS